MIGLLALTVAHARLPDLDGDGFDSSIDCDDTDPTVFPGAPERCDGIDNDCSGIVDDGKARVAWFPDVDGDSFGDGTQVPVFSCVPPAGGLVANGLDCDDTNPAVNPAQPDVCDELDNNCDRVWNDGAPLMPVFADLDGDRFGDPANLLGEGCLSASGNGYFVQENAIGGVSLFRTDGVEDSNDCDDHDPFVNPAAPEVCDGIDNNCDQWIDEGCPKGPTGSTGDTGDGGGPIGPGPSDPPAQRSGGACLSTGGSLSAVLVLPVGLLALRRRR